MPFSAKIIADSVNAMTGVRLITYQLEYPRFIHAELMTHRVFSRNASSSRAIPVAKTLAAIAERPVIPISWGKNQKGMQAHEDVDAETAAKAEAIWLRGASYAMETAKGLVDLGIHKQIANRVLEPWAHISTIVTATEWDNWFALRDHADAQPEIRRLAELMRIAREASTPVVLKEGEWHLPYIRPEDWDIIRADVAARWRDGPAIMAAEYENEQRAVEHMVLMVCAARCARVSYNTHDNEKPLLLNDLALAETLLTSKHMSPFEHAATPCHCPAFHANFRSYYSHRFIMEMTEKMEVQQAMSQKAFFDMMARSGVNVEGAQTQ